MSKINLPYKRYIPDDIVYLIADFHDYEKYCKPSHYENLKYVLKDIIDMAEIMPNISPNICIQCWGTRGINEFYHESDEEDYDDFEYEGGGWWSN